ncbi:protein-disulfide reductase DsbD family protein [Algoriphagus resistens]|uniref:protein-disulfide reductase DsbD family protein n=1 Tax=Algoriphagus resistens TaxID=1750590 RepID=UPI000716B5A9|nr:cytochrome c biogenesis protein CcdA [Algoriphagus resistens]
MTRSYKNCRFLLLFFFLILSGTTSSQILKPATWSYTASTKEIKVNDQIELIFNITIDKDWYMYSTDFDPDLGPMVTTFNFQPNKTYELIGEIKPINPKKIYSETWKGEYTYFVETAQFRQLIKVLSNDLVLEGNVEYQVCTDVDGKCIPFDQDFSFSDFVVPSQNSAPEVTAKTNTTTEIPDGHIQSIPVEKGEKVKTADGSVTHNLKEPSEPINDPTRVNEEFSSKKNTELEVSPDLLKPEKAVSEISSVNLSLIDPKPSVSLLSFMLIAFLAGMAALITPCVFPMIPMTVTFFTSDSKDRKQAIAKALVYGLSIIVIYTLIGTLVSRLNGPGFANWLSTHWIPNLMFFAIFIFFGLSFLGLFEIVLPHALVNKIDKEADKGGYYGAIFMAFTIVLVSFSCTGPIVGSILVESAGGAIIKPIAGMFAFSMAFAIPFTLFAIFPDWLKNLPKSGGWLNSVKVVLGFLELALALKFLSIADQVYHWKILDREVFLALWIAFFTGMVLYLLGKIRLLHDSEFKTIGVPRLILALLTLSFIIYLIPGLFGAPLKSLAGFLPPMTTQDFNLRTMSASGSANVTTLCEESPNNPASLSFPHGIEGYFDLEQALSCAQSQNKPIFIDFTGHGCVNCRKMEERVWSEPEVLSRLKNDFIMVALYIDEKTELPESEWYTSTYDAKVKKTIGSQNSDMQITKFQNNAQPYYVIMDPKENVLVRPISYETDVEKFIEFLDEGIYNYKTKSENANAALK